MFKDEDPSGSQMRKDAGEGNSRVGMPVRAATEGVLPFPGTISRG